MYRIDSDNLILNVSPISCNHVIIKDVGSIKIKIKRIDRIPMQLRVKGRL